MAIQTNLYTHDDLYRVGPQRSFTGANLSEVSFPIGGIGTGVVNLGGRGNLRAFELNGHPDRNNVMSYTFFALWAKEEGKAPVARILEGRIPPPYRDGGGERAALFSGIPRFENASFQGEYPVGMVTLDDPGVPVQATLKAWNPMIPLNVHDSALPVAIFEWTFTNITDAPVEISLASGLYNPLQVKDENGNLTSKGMLNAPRINPDLQGVLLTHPDADPLAPETGSLALSTSWKDTDVIAHWYRSEWFDAGHIFWDDFSEDGRVAPVLHADPSPLSPHGEQASLVLRAVVPAGASVTLPVFISWNFPKMKNPWPGTDAPKTLDTYAGAHFKDAWDVAGYVGANFDRLSAETERYRAAIFGGTLPDHVLEAVTGTASIMRSMTCFLLADGNFFGWEGVWDTVGSCHGSCTHVWNYEQALAFLFPQLERTMRRTEFLHNTRDTGNMAFRTHLPPGQGLYRHKPCVDGQMGTIIQVYRDWQLSGDDAFLREIWPKVKSALEYAWTMTPEKMAEGGHDTWNAIVPEIRSVDSLWDLDKDGLIEGEQHNTYDIEFFGPNTMSTAMYLGALRACEEIAKHFSEDDKAAEYRSIYESGRARVDAELWNGEYYFQKVNVIPEVTIPHMLRSPASTHVSIGRPETTDYPKYQIGEGCLSDQLLGQWAAHVAGLGHILDADHVRTAVGSIFRHNFRDTMRETHSVQRIYGLNDEAGLMLASWPHGNRPVIPSVYCDEMWTGIEYQVAAHLIFEGWIDEGLTLVKAVSERYAGYNRNPWNQIECGNNYARAMAAWSVKLALDGFRYSVPAGILGFAPKINREGYATFWSVGSSWGTYRQHPAVGVFTLEVLYGEVLLQRLELADLPQGNVSVLGPKGTIAIARDGDAVAFGEWISLQSGETIEVRVG